MFCLVLRLYKCCPTHQFYKLLQSWVVLSGNTDTHYHGNINVLFCMSTNVTIFVPYSSNILATFTKVHVAQCLSLFEFIFQTFWSIKKIIYSPDLSHSTYIHFHFLNIDVNLNRDLKYTYAMTCQNQHIEWAPS